MMTNSEKDQLVGIYGVANTPLYLLKALQRHPAVSRMAEAESNAEHLQRVKHLLADARSISDMAEAYARIVAMLLRERLQFEEIPAELTTLDGLDWLSPILAWNNATKVDSTITTVTVHATDTDHSNSTIAPGSSQLVEIGR